MKLPFLDIRKNSILAMIYGCTLYIHYGSKLEYTINSRNR